MSDRFLTELAGLSVNHDPAWEEAKQRLWAMTADERRAAMYAGTLSFRLCLHWASRAPAEVPTLNGEFWFIAIHTPEVADTTDPSAAADDSPSSARPCRY